MGKRFNLRLLIYFFFILQYFADSLTRIPRELKFVVTEDETRFLIKKASKLLNQVSQPIEFML